MKRWEESLRLHARYASLDDERYRHVQPWPKHERPAQWIIKLAQEKLSVLTRIVAKRNHEGDRAFLEALELMGFLSSLVGLSNVERFVPLCNMEGERREVLNAAPPPNSEPPSTPAPPSNDHTREMPKLAAGQMGRMLLAQKAGVPYQIASEPRRTTASAAASPKKRSADTLAATRNAMPQGPDALIVADALRLLGWGRQWHELPDIIERLGDRPSIAHIRRVLREHRALIERRHSAAAD